MHTGGLGRATRGSRRHCGTVAAAGCGSYPPALVACAGHLPHPDDNRVASAVTPPAGIGAAPRAETPVAPPYVPPVLLMGHSAGLPLPGRPPDLLVGRLSSCAEEGVEVQRGMNAGSRSRRAAALSKPQPSPPLCLCPCRAPALCGPSGRAPPAPTASTACHCTCGSSRAGCNTQAGSLLLLLLPVLVSWGLLHIMTARGSPPGGGRPAAVLLLQGLRPGRWGWWRGCWSAGGWSSDCAAGGRAGSGG